MRLLLDSAADKDVVMMAIRAYVLQKVKKLPRYPCNDCGVDVLTIGDWYMASPEIWEKQLGLGWGDNLCITCLERRLGRPLRPGWGEDVGLASTRFTGQPPLSPRLLTLLGLEQKRCAHKQVKGNA
jgi:hypothetical protein